MANATTEKFEEMTLEVEVTAGSGTYSKLCGLIDVSVTRTANVDTAEVPDCDDESLPLSVEKQVRSVEYSASASGVWAQESWGTMQDWFRSAATKSVRIYNAQASSGDPQYETGNALLTTLNNSRTKGQKVTAEIEIMWDGTPSVTDAS